jgi:hypothetical protein
MYNSLRLAPLSLSRRLDGFDLLGYLSLPIHTLPIVFLASNAMMPAPPCSPACCRGDALVMAVTLSVLRHR